MRICSLLLLCALLGLSVVATAAPLSRASDIEAPGPNGSLKGTLTSGTTQQGPIALIIPGSGPTDRDGNSPLGVKAAPYKLLAEGLAARGIRAVRIDKRGMFASAAAVPDANAVTVDDYVRDTRAWIDVIRQRGRSKCVWLLGHSEGGLIALATAEQSSENICGLVLIAAAGRPLGDVLKEQLRANPANGSLIDTAFSAIDSLAAGKRVDSVALPPALHPLFQPAVQGFLISAFALEPAQMIREIDKPVLILQGMRDIQISTQDAEILKTANPAATLTLLPDINHVLKRVASDDRGANVATYADPEMPVAPEVVEAVADFVTIQDR